LGISDESFIFLFKLIITENKMICILHDNIISNDILVHILEFVLTKHGGSKHALKLVRNRIIEKYGISLLIAIGDWQKIDDILQENFGQDGAYNIGKKYMQSLSKILTDLADPNRKLITEPQHISAIMKVIGDKDMLKMMDCVMDKALSRDNIIKDTGVRQITVYSKIKMMIKNGILVEDGHEFAINRTRISKYTTSFKMMHISIKKNNDVVIELVTKKDLKKHSILIPKVFIE